MLSFRVTMDKNSLDIIRDEKFVGFLQKHSESKPRLVMISNGIHELSLDELESCVNRLKSFIIEGK